MFRAHNTAITARIVAFICDENAGSAPAFLCWKGASAMHMRRHSRQTIPLNDRLAAFAAEAREKAESMIGVERDDLLKKASIADTAVHIDDWINSSGLRPPK